MAFETQIWTRAASPIRAHPAIMAPPDFRVCTPHEAFHVDAEKPL